MGRLSWEEGPSDRPGVGVVVEVGQEVPTDALQTFTLASPLLPALQSPWRKHFGEHNWVIEAETFGQFVSTMGCHILE